MEKKQKLFLGFVVMILAAFITMAGCDSGNEEGVKFPSGFIGTWERVDSTYQYQHTLTLTSDSIKASNQAHYWYLKAVVGGDLYEISKDDSDGDPIYIKLGSNILEIIDATDINNPGVDPWSGTEDDWTGTWRRK